MTSPILVIGHTGQLAQALKETCANTVSLSRTTIDLGWDETQIKARLEAAIAKYNPRGMINAAAYTQVDKAEKERELAFAINANAPGLLAKVCAEHSLPFVHVSTDYVFDGQGRSAWKEDDTPDPLNVYGESKLLGEQNILSEGGVAAILRTSWVYDLTGRNFATTMLRLGQDRDRLTVVDDQIGRPTHASDLAKACLNALGNTGLYHVSGTGEPISWAGFAQAIFSEAGLATTVVPVPSSDFPTDAQRPAWSVLDTSRFEIEIAPLRNWREALTEAFNCRFTFNQAKGSHGTEPRFIKNP